MKITYLINSFSAGGKERQLFYLLKSLAKENSIQLIIFSEEVFYEEIYNLPIQIIKIATDKKYSLESVKSIYNKIKDFTPEIIHSWYNIGTLLIFPYLLFNISVPLISSIRYAGKIKKTHKSLLIKFISHIRSSAIVSNSKHGLKVEKLQSSRKGITIYNGIDIKQFNTNLKNTNRSSSKIEDFENKVVMLASFSPAKDFVTFVKVAQKVYQQNKDTCFIYIGDGPYRPLAEKEAVDYLNKNIFFLGKRNNIPSILNNMDIGVLLNNTNGHAEGISNAIMEYMAAELPVIATNAGGTPELVQNNISGFLIPAFDVNVVAEKILYLKNNQNRARKMGKAGRKIIEKDFSIKQMTESYLNLYERLIHEK